MTHILAFITGGLIVTAIFAICLFAINETESIECPSSFNGDDQCSKDKCQLYKVIKNVNYNETFKVDTINHVPCDKSTGRYGPLAHLKAWEDAMQNLTGQGLTVDFGGPILFDQLSDEFQRYLTIAVSMTFPFLREYNHTKSMSP